MRTLLAAVALVLAAPALAACGSDDGATKAFDDEPTRTVPDPPTEIPAAPGTVRSTGLVTVMDDGGPQLCVGPVAESWPPQCTGPAIAGWRWNDHDGVFEHQGEVRWGQFAVTGTWDGSTFGYADAVPAALYDPMPTEKITYPAPEQSGLSELELVGITQVVDDLPGAQGAYADGGHVFVDVIYDDGSLQGWADTAYGKNLVIIRPALVDQ